MPRPRYPLRYIHPAFQSTDMFTIESSALLPEAGSVYPGRSQPLLRSATKREFMVGYEILSPTAGVGFGTAGGTQQAI